MSLNKMLKILLVQMAILYAIFHVNSGDIPINAGFFAGNAWLRACRSWLLCFCV